MLGVWAAVIKLGIQVVTWDRIYRYLELIAVSGIILAFFVLLRLPMTGPFDLIFITSWWKWLYLVIVAAVGSVLGAWAVLCAVIVWPLLLPYKLLANYVLSPDATLLTALVAFPIVFLVSSVAFTMVYLALIQSGKGNLTKDKIALYTPGESWPLVEMFYFSLSTMVKGTPQYEAPGWCRWTALAEITAGRLLEVAMVTVGIGTILKRGLGGTHP